MTYSALFLITALLFIGDFLILAPTAFAACRSAQSLFGIADATGGGGSVAGECEPAELCKIAIANFKKFPARLR